MTLERWARRPSSRQALALRARLVLSCAAGKSNGAVARVQLADDLAGGHLQRRKQRGGAVPHVVVGPPLGLTGSHRQQRLAAVERLNLALLIDTQHQRPCRRIEVEPHDV